MGKSSHYRIESKQWTHLRIRNPSLSHWRSCCAFLSFFISAKWNVHSCTVKLNVDEHYHFFKIWSSGKLGIQVETDTVQLHLPSLRRQFHLRCAFGSWPVTLDWDAMSEKAAAYSDATSRKKQLKLSWWGVESMVESIYVPHRPARRGFWTHSAVRFNQSS